MRKTIIVSLLSLCFALMAAPTSTTLAATTGVVSGELEIRDRGFPRQFEVATNEVWVKAPRLQRSHAIPTQANAEATRQHAITLSRASGQEVELVLYEKGARRDTYSRRVLTKEVLVQVAPGTDAEALATTAGARWRGPVTDLRGYHFLEATETGGALLLAERLRAEPGVLSAEPQLAKQQAKRFVPNDPLFPNQWHLRNTGQGGGTSGVDVNITGVWDTFRGKGMVIGIIDDGLQTTHPDLAPAVNTTIDWDFNDNDGDPSPNILWDYHGTSCAGVAAARGNNSLGVSGAAPEATLAGLRLISEPSTDAMESSAMKHTNDVIYLKSNSWGPSDWGDILEGPGSLTLAALAQAASSGRNGLGTIITWAGGNGLENNDNANYDGYANSIYTIAIGALSDRGTQATYSEPGACLVVTAPSSSDFRQGITTVDLMGDDGYNYSGAFGELSDGDYTQDFGGTSSATPLATGVIALMLEANPRLGWRDVQEILIRTATLVSPTDSDWAVNGAGLHFNHKFGAGLINASAAVALAQNWTNLDPQSTVSASQSALSLAIPDNNSTGVSRDFVFTAADLRIEHVTVTVNIAHTSRGDLEITLISPSGKQSRLAERHEDSGDNYPDWKFMTVHHWGESLPGTWTVKVADRRGGNTGRLNSVQLDFYGVRQAAIEVSPDTNLASAGQIGGPFSPASAVFTVANSGATSLEWQVSRTQPWIALSSAGGTLAGNASTAVSVSLNPNANALLPGVYTDTILFTNLTSGLGSTTRQVSLVVTSSVVADFNAVPLQGMLPLAVRFTNLSLGATNYLWEFGDGNTSKLPNPTNRYADAGTYSVRLTAFGSGWSNTAVRANYIVVTNPPLPVIASGNDAFGQKMVPREVTNIIAVAAGGWHTLSLKSNGTILTWGNNWDGQCSVPTTLPDLVAVAAGGYHSLAVRANGSVIGWGNNFYGQTNVPPGLPPILAIAAGDWHSLALAEDGRVFAWGDNSGGQCAVPANLSSVMAIAANGNHSLALKRDGTVVAWGQNTDAQGNWVGQSVVPAGLMNIATIAAGDYHSLALKADGTVIGWGDNSRGQAQPPAGLTGVAGLAAGGLHSLALGRDGTVTAWGDNWNGQCDVAPDLPATAIAAGGYHSLVLLEGGPRLGRLFRPGKRGNAFGVVLQSRTRGRYALEYRDSWSQTGWTALPAVNGNGALLLLTDPNPNAAQRFYHVREF